MSAEVLRQAANLMRERAEAVDMRDYERRIVAKTGRRTPAGRHIAGMSPDVALAVAGLLTALADDLQAGDDHDGFDSSVYTAGVDLARAYLGDVTAPADTEHTEQQAALDGDAAAATAPVAHTKAPRSDEQHAEVSLGHRDDERR